MSRKSYESGNPPLRWRNCIRVVREAQGISQADLARAAGMDRQNLSRLEAHRREPSVGVLLRLAAALHCRVDDLIELEDAGEHERFISRCGDLRKVDPITGDVNDE